MSETNKVIEILNKAKTIIEKWVPMFDQYNTPAGIDDAIALLKEQEAYKPKGHWMPYEPDKRGYTDGFTCSRCERVISSDHYCKMIDFDFCPYCGAHMDNAEGW